MHNILTKLSIYLEKICIASIPIVTVLLSVFVSIFPYKTHYFSLVIPLFTNITVYFWSIYKPQNLPYVAVFIIGLFKDILENNTMGISAVSLLLLQGMARSQRRYIMNHSFIVIWAGFIFSLSIILLIPFIFNYFSIDITLYNFTIIFSQWLITILVYVPFHYLLKKLNELVK